MWRQRRAPTIVLACFEPEDPVREFKDETVPRDLVAPVREFVGVDYVCAVDEDGVDVVAERAAPKFSRGVFFSFLVDGAFSWRLLVVS
jgi:hypothetical protein